MREVAHVRDYDDLVEAVRTRLSELSATTLALDNVAGLPSGYTGKLLGAKRIKRFGMTSLGPTLEALGVKMIVVVDEESERRFSERMRNTRQRPAKGVSTEAELEESRVLKGLLADYRLRTLMSGMAKIYGGVGGRVRAARLSKEKRHRIAKAAAGGRPSREG
jgi:hypothetical protein